MNNFIATGMISAVFAATLPFAPSHAASPGAAQSYPQRPVRIIVNVSAGGGVDIVARIVAQHAAAVWERPVIVDNRTGAAGNIGVELVIKAPADGYTLLVSSSTVVTNAAARPEGYNPVRDLRPVAKLTSNPYIVCASPTLPITSVKELIALAKSKPGGLSFASSGAGSILHMSAELLTQLAGTPMTHVPYKGVADAYPPVATGQVDWVIGAPLSALPYIKGGRLRGLAVTSKERSRTLPDLPTMLESGVAGYEVIAWFGMFGPVGIPADIVAKISAEARRALQTPEVLRRMETESTDVATNSANEFGLEVKAEYEKWRNLVVKTGMKF